MLRERKKKKKRVDSRERANASEAGEARELWPITPGCHWLGVLRFRSTSTSASRRLAAGHLASLRRDTAPLWLALLLSASLLARGVKRASETASHRVSRMGKTQNHLEGRRETKQRPNKEKKKAGNCIERAKLQSSWTGTWRTVAVNGDEKGPDACVKTGCVEKVSYWPGVKKRCD